MINVGLVDSMGAVREEDRRVSIRELSDRIDAGRTTTDVILKARLKWKKKVFASWIPRILTEENNKTRVSAFTIVLRRYSLTENQFLDKAGITDETMMNIFDPETKQDSSAWKRASSSPPLNAMALKSVMFIFFMDRRRMLLVHAIPQGQSVNASYYSEV